MRQIITLITLQLSLSIATNTISAQTTNVNDSPYNDGYVRGEWIELDGERVATIHLQPIVCFSNKTTTRRYSKLVVAVKKVYPIAKFARDKLAEAEAELAQIPTKKGQKEYIQTIYKELLEEYTPVLKTMTQTQGRILVRLIDRETEYTAYEVVDEFRGSLSAAFWQGVGRLFGQNLKSEYGSSEEDKLIELIINYYEAGLL